MKILFVSGTLPPEGSATAGIIGNLMIEMKNRGEDVSGLTFKNHISDANESYWNGIDIYHAEYVREYNFKSNTLSDILFKAKRKICDLVHKSQMRPYRELAVTALEEKLLGMDADNIYDVIIAIAAFYDAVEAVRRYKKRINRQVKAEYALYQVDPLQENHAFNDVDSVWLETYEKELYFQSDCIFTTRIIYEMKERKKWPMDNVTAVDFPCVDISLSTRLSTIKKSNNEIRCIYAGLLNEQIRDATAVLEILSHIRNPHISFYFIGTGQEELLHKYSDGVLKGRLHIMGSMPATECEDWLLSADILIIIGNNVINQVPSKVFSYMSYGLPIVATCKSAECPERKYLTEIPNALIIDESVQESDVEYLSNLIEGFITKYSGTRLTSKQIERYADSYTPEHVVSAFISELSKHR